MAGNNWKKIKYFLRFRIFCKLSFVGRFRSRLFTAYKISHNLPLREKYNFKEIYSFFFNIILKSEKCLSLVLILVSDSHCRSSYTTHSKSKLSLEVTCMTHCGIFLGLIWRGGQGKGRHKVNVLSWRHEHVCFWPLFGPTFQIVPIYTRKINASMTLEL